MFKLLHACEIAVALVGVLGSILTRCLTTIPVVTRRAAMGKIVLTDEVFEK